MRDRTHGKESKTKREVYEARIDAKKNMGTYKSSIAMNGDSEDDDEQTTNEQRDHTQQLSDVSINKQETKNKKQKTKQYCPWCKAETDHKTWQSVRCSAHDEYLLQKISRKTKIRKNTIDVTYDDDEGKKEEEVSEVSFGGGGGGGGVAIGGAVPNDSHYEEKNIAMNDIALLLSMRENNENDFSEK